MPAPPLAWCDRAPSANAFLAASPRFSMAALRSSEIAAFTASISAGKRRFGIGRHRHIDRLETLEVLVVRLGQQLRGVDADELGLRLDPARVDADAVLAVVDISVHGRPEVGRALGRGRRRRCRPPSADGEIMRVGEVHPAALVDDLRLQELRQARPGAARRSRVRAARSATITGFCALARSRAASFTAPLSPCGGDVGT